MPDVVVLSGAGLYADPWHPFDDTSAAIAALIERDGLSCAVRDVAPDALDRPPSRLLVVNAGGGDPENRPDPDDSWNGFFERITAWAGERPTLVVHTGVNTGWPGWAERVGGRWVRGVSEHPRMSVATFQAVDPGHPVTEGLPTGDGIGGLDGIPVVTCYDERYQGLEIDERAVPLYGHETGEFHVCGWQFGTVIYDGLGHDTRSYASRTRRRLLSNEIGVLLGS